jgi:hypothetical protein
MHIPGVPGKVSDAAEPDIPRIQMNVSDAAVAVPLTANGRMNARPGLKADAQSGILQLMPETSANGQSTYQSNTTNVTKRPI